MSEPVFTNDASVEAFADAGGAVSTDDDGVDFSWDEEHVVRLDAPADLKGAFDTDRFYKIADATIARPIKQPYRVGDSIEWYKKPAEELRKAAWTFDNNPFVFPHPDTGMVKDVNDVHGFWRNVHYQDDSDRLRGDLYIPTSDKAALDWIEKHQDVSPGFYNRVTKEYDGDTGDLTDDDVDGFQTDLYGDHIAGVKQGRCTGSDGCGLEHDSQHVYNKGTVVSWQSGDARGKIVDSKTDGCFSDRIDGDHEICADDEPVYLIEEDDGKTVAHKHGTLTVESSDTGTVVSVDQTTSFLSEEEMTQSDEMFTESDEVVWRADAVVAHNPDDENGVMVEILDRNGDSTEMVITVDEDDLWHKRALMNNHDRDYLIAPPTADYEDDGTYYAIAPDETDGDEPKYPINSCSDVDDAWHLRGHGDYNIEQSTLESRIKERARELDCDVPGETEKNEDSNPTNNCNCNTTMTDKDDFDLPDLSIDALAEKNDAVQKLKEEHDSLKSDLDERRERIDEAFDSAENFTIDLDDDECRCDGVEQLVEDLDAKVEKVENLRNELDEYRQKKIDAKLDRLEELGAERDEWAETADEAADPLDTLDTEIERREEVLDAADVDVSVKDIDMEKDEDGTDTTEETMSGTRTFGRGHGA